MKRSSLCMLLVLGLILAASAYGSQDPFWSYAGSSYHEEIGWRVLTCGDVNGDSIPDFIGSAWSYDNDRGRVFVFSGESPFPILFVYVGQNSGDLFGTSVGAGDFDGDGLCDIAVGSP